MDDELQELNQEFNRAFIALGQALGCIGANFAAAVADIFADMFADPMWESYFAPLDEYGRDGDREKMQRRVAELMRKSVL